MRNNSISVLEQVWRRYNVDTIDLDADIGSITAQICPNIRNQAHGSEMPE